jgi:hypothetical protein
MISGTACGPTFGTEKIFQSSCYSTAFGSNTGQSSNTISTAIGLLETCLGGGYQVAYHDPAKSQSTCSANEISLLGNYRLYESILQCSIMATATPYDLGTMTFSNEWIYCLQGTIWSSAPPAITRTADPVTCWGCFGEYATRVFQDSAGVKLLCRGVGKTSYDSDCVNAVEGRDFINFLRKCTGGTSVLVTSRTTCSGADIDSFSSLSKSAILIVKSAKMVFNDPTITDFVDKKIRGFQILRNVLVQSTGPTMVGKPCENCYASLVADLINNFHVDSASLNACSNEFDEECFQNPKNFLSLSSFVACAGFELDTSNFPYKCSSSDASVIQKFQFGPIIYDFVIGQRVASAPIGVVNMNALFDKANITFACMPCFNDAIINLFNVNDATLTACRQSNRSTCSAQPAIKGVMDIFTLCSGVSLSFDAFVPSNITNSTNNGTITNTSSTDNTLNSTTTSKSVYSEFRCIFLIIYLIITMEY